MSQPPRFVARPAGLIGCLGCLTLQMASLSAQAPDPTLTVQRVAAPPKLEDFLSADPPPGVREVSDFRQREPGDGVPVSAPTTAYLAYDAANLYVVFICKDDPATVRASLTKREEISVEALGTFLLRAG